MSALLALGLCFWAALRLTPRWTPPGGGRVESLAATAVLLPTLGISTVRVLAGVGALRPWELLAAFGCLALIAELTATARGRPAVRAQAALEAAAALPLALGTLAVSLALVTAVGLPIWQWDSLGYHLPFVAYALQAGSLSGVPWALPYIGSYPHGVELWDLGARALLSDDRFLDAAQLPLCLCGAVAIAGLSRLAKASASAAVAAGALWLCLPAVFLQLPSVYVDVASAAFFLLAMFWIASAVSAQAAVLAGLALGLFLNSKPSSPAAVLLLGLAFAVRAWRSDRSSLRRSALRRSSLRRSTLRPSVLTLLAAALVLALGAESYVTNAVAHGNPLWPVRFDLGPVHLNCQDSLANLLASGAAAPHLLGSLPSRLLRSWTALEPLPAFDMRIGGFGPLFLLFALPIGLVGAMRRGRGMGRGPPGGARDPRPCHCPLHAASAGLAPGIERGRARTGSPLVAGGGHELGRGSGSRWALARATGTDGRHSASRGARAWTGREGSRTSSAGNREPLGRAAAGDGPADDGRGGSLL